MLKRENAAKTVTEKLVFIFIYFLDMFETSNSNVVLKIVALLRPSYGDIQMFFSNLQL